MSDLPAFGGRREGDGREMKAKTAALLGAALALGVALGRSFAPPSPEPDPPTLAAFRDSLEEGDWLTRSYRYSAYLQRLGPAELPEALAALERRRAWLSQDELRIFMLAWTRFDAPAAFAHALTWPGRLRRTGAGAALYAWAFRDPDAALAALDALEDEQLGDFLRTRLVAGWARSEHKDRLSRYAASLPEGAQRDSFVGMLARELNEQGSESLMRWADAVPDLVPSYKRSVFRKACAALASTDPLTAVRWAAGHAGRDYAAGSSAVIAGRWASLDPKAALEWLVGLPADPERDAAIADAFTQWLGLARGEAELWLLQETPSAELDPAVRAAVRRTNQDGSPKSAVEWAKRIEAAEVRENVIAGVVRAWVRREPEAAQRWLEASDLSEGLRASIRDGR
jgi:hypothetical protein